MQIIKASYTYFILLIMITSVILSIQTIPVNTTYFYTTNKYSFVLGTETRCYVSGYSVLQSYYEEGFFTSGKDYFENHINWLLNHDNVLSIAKNYLKNEYPDLYETVTSSSGVKVSIDTGYNSFILGDKYITRYVVNWRIYGKYMVSVILYVVDDNEIIPVGIDLYIDEIKSISDDKLVVNTYETVYNKYVKTREEANVLGLAIELVENNTYGDGYRASFLIKYDGIPIGVLTNSSTYPYNILSLTLEYRYIGIGGEARLFYENDYYLIKYLLNEKIVVKQPRVDEAQALNILKSEYKIETNNTKIHEFYTITDNGELVPTYSIAINSGGKTYYVIFDRSEGKIMKRSQIPITAGDNNMDNSPNNMDPQDNNVDVRETNNTDMNETIIYTSVGIVLVMALLLYTLLIRRRR